MSKDDKLFNHDEAYADSGPMGEMIMSILDLATEKNCPILIMAAVERTEENTKVALVSHQSESRPLAPIMLMAANLPQASPRAIQIIDEILQMDAAAHANADQMMQALKEIQRERYKVMSMSPAGISTPSMA